MKKYEKSFKRIMITEESLELVAYFTVRMLAKGDGFPLFADKEALFVNVLYQTQSTDRGISKFNESYCLVRKSQEWLLYEIQGKKCKTIHQQDMSGMQIWIKNRTLFEYNHR